MNANQNGSLGSDRLSKYESIRRPHGRKIWIIPFCRAAVAGLAKSEIILNSEIGTLYIYALSNANESIYLREAINCEKKRFL